MSSDPIGELERKLRSAVRARAAPRPAWPSRLRARLGLPLILSVGAVAVGGGGALAASQLLREGPPINEFAPPAKPDTGAGVAQGDAAVLALRVKDPYGGPPWGLRVFASSRGGSCVQVGRVQRGRLGRVVATADGAERFRPLETLPGTNSLCGGVQRDGFPVLRGLRRVELRGGSSDPRRCAGGPCPIDQARILRFGLLGPKARRATFVTPGGRAAATQRLLPQQGGAYLFVQRTDPAPFQAAEAAQQQIERRIAATIRRLRARGLNESQALQQASRLSRTVARPRSLGLGRLLAGEDGVDARFSDGTRLRVAGSGRAKAALPGVTRHRGSTPDVRAPLRVTVRGRRAQRRFTISFLAPVAITRADRHYTLTATGHDGAHCTLRVPGGGQATTRNIAEGQRVTFHDVRAHSNTGAGRTTWCPGTTTLRVGYQTPGSTFSGRLVGAYRFAVKP